MGVLPGNDVVCFRARVQRVLACCTAFSCLFVICYCGEGIVRVVCVRFESALKGWILRVHLQAPRSDAIVGAKPMSALLGSLCSELLLAMHSWLDMAFLQGSFKVPELSCSSACIRSLL